MIVPPSVTPLTSPEPSTVATDVVLLAHVPPVKASVRLVITPVQVIGVPPIGLGTGFIVTVTVANAAHGLGTLNVIVAVPAEAPVTIPKLGSIVATLLLLLLHVPCMRPVGLLRVKLPPLHTAMLPVIAPTGLHKTVIDALPLAVAVE